MKMNQWIMVVFFLDHGLGTLGDGAGDAIKSKNSPKANMIGVIEAEENFQWGEL